MDQNTNPNGNLDGLRSTITEMLYTKVSGTLTKGNFKGRTREVGQQRARRGEEPSAGLHAQAQEGLRTGRIGNLSLGSSWYNESRGKGDSEKGPGD